MTAAAAPAQIYNTLPEIPDNIKPLIAQKEIIDLTMDLRDTPGDLGFIRKKTVDWLKNSILTNFGLVIAGKAGTGKTTLLNQIAHLANVTTDIKGISGKRVFLVKKRSLAIFEEIAKAKYGNQCILLVDEAHQHIGRWHHGAEEYRETLLPYIRDRLRPLHSIWFTNRPDEIFEGNGSEALRRRFLVYNINEMSIPEAIHLVKSNKAGLEKYLESLHNMPITVTDEAIAVAAKLAQSLLPREYYPAKVDKILEVAAAAAVRTGKTVVDEEIVKAQTMQDYNLTKDALDYKLDEVNLSLRVCEIPADEPIAKLTTNLTLKALAGEIHPAYGREKELEKIMSVLSATQSNNVLLIGPSGCGKTRLAEGLACLIAEGKVPPSLANKQVLLLDLNVLIGDTKYRGELETKIDSFLKSARNHRNTIFFIDEFHTIIRAGRSEGSESAANAFKAAWARGELSTIGATTDKEFPILKADPAILRRFQKRHIVPLSIEVTKIVFEQERETIEKEYEKDKKLSLTITSNAFDAIAYLATKYEKVECLPGSAMKLLHAILGPFALRPSTDKIQVTEEDVIDYVYKEYVAEADHAKEGKAIVRRELHRLREYHKARNLSIPLHEPIMRYSENLTEKAARGSFDDVEGRDDVVDQMIEILSKHKINNILLMGQSGVGKTAIIKRLARKMSDNDVPPFLKDKLLLSLNFREILESKDPEILTSVLKSAENHCGQAVIFIDEIHTLLNSPAFDQFKPLLADGKLHLIGATTSEEGANAFEKALAKIAMSRRFEKITVSPMDEAQALRVIKKIKTEVETHYSKAFKIPFTISDQAILEAIRATQFSDLPQPAAALDFLDKLAAKKSIIAFKQKLGSVHISLSDINPLKPQVDPIIDPEVKKEPAKISRWKNTVAKVKALFKAWYKKFCSMLKPSKTPKKSWCRRVQSAFRPKKSSPRPRPGPGPKSKIRV